VELVFPGNELTALDTVQLTWHDGGMQPDVKKIKLPTGVEELPASGTYWIGESGAIFKKYGASRPVVVSDEDYPIERHLQALSPQNHYHDWVDAILAGRNACDDFTHGGPLTEAVLVGAMADRVAGQWLEWNHKALRFTNNAQANALVRREYREGWKVPGLG
jgi:hypothetical protein